MDTEQILNTYCVVSFIVRPEASLQARVGLVTGLYTRMQ
jgi:hypothetical protein